jgi:hypothetical protein
MTESPLMTLKEAARLIPGASPETLRTEHRGGKLPFYRIGRRVYVKPDEVLAMIDLCRVQQSPLASGLTPSASNGSSRTIASSSAQDALERIVGRPNSASGTTLQRNMSRPNRAKIALGY